MRGGGRHLLLASLVLLGGYGLIQALDTAPDENASPRGEPRPAAPAGVATRIIVTPPAQPEEAKRPLREMAKQTRHAPAGPASVSVQASAANPAPAPAPALAAVAVAEMPGVISAAVAAEPVQVAAAPRPPAQAPAQPSVAAATRRMLPDRFTLRYAVYYGEDDIRLGDAVYEWRLDQGRYSLVSTVQASGVASLFLGGKLIQNSEGRVTSGGLKPERYWLIRKGQKRDVADFDWSLGRLRLGDESLALHDGSQDLLSFPFHLAITADSALAPWRLWVTNGRKLRDYQFRNLGRERLKVAGEEMETFHLRGSHVGEDNLDVWLAPGRHWLPARIRTLDNKGKVTQMNLEEGG